MWDKIQGIGVQKNALQIRNSAGAKEKINLPLHTKSQLDELKSYLKKMVETKGLEYIN